MRTLLLWENCPIFDGQRAYWVEVPLDVFRRDLQDLELATNISGGSLGAYLQSVDRAAKNYPHWVKKNHVYLLVRADGLAYELPAPTMPYSPMWNAYCPFVAFQKEIADLSGLSQLGLCI